MLILRRDQFFALVSVLPSQQLVHAMGKIRLLEERVHAQTLLLDQQGQREQSTEHTTQQAVESRLVPTYPLAVVPMDHDALSVNSDF